MNLPTLRPLVKRAISSSCQSLQTWALTLDSDTHWSPPHMHEHIFSVTLPFSGHLGGRPYRGPTLTLINTICLNTKNNSSGIVCPHPPTATGAIQPVLQARMVCKSALTLSIAGLIVPRQPSFAGCGNSFCRSDSFPIRRFCAALVR